MPSELAGSGAWAGGHLRYPAGVAGHSPPDWPGPGKPCPKRGGLSSGTDVGPGKCLGAGGSAWGDACLGHGRPGFGPGGRKNLWSQTTPWAKGYPGPTPYMGRQVPAGPADMDRVGPMW
jgi:hypothetical protein